MIKGLEEFLFEANVLDPTVAAVIGAAFNTIATSPIGDITTPPLLNSALKAAGMGEIAELSQHSVAYGSFLSAVISFLIVSTTLFFIVRTVNAASVFGKKQDEVEEEATPIQGELLIEIHGLLKEK